MERVAGDRTRLGMVWGDRTGENRGGETKKEKGVKEKGIRDTERTLQESKGE